MFDRYQWAALAVLIGQAALGAAMYRARVARGWPIFDSDVFVFAVPVLVGAAAQVSLALRLRRADGLGPAIVLGAVLPAIGFVVTMLVSLNLWGS